MVLDLLPVNDEREVIAAVLEVIADFAAVEVTVPGKNLLETHPALLFGKARHKLIGKARRQRPQGILFYLRGRDVLILHILLQNFPLMQQLLRGSFPRSGQHRLSALHTLHQCQLVQAVKDMRQGGFRLIQISGGVGHRPLFRLRLQKIQEQLDLDAVQIFRHKKIPFPNLRTAKQAPFAVSPANRRLSCIYNSGFREFS